MRQPSSPRSCSAAWWPGGKIGGRLTRKRLPLLRVLYRAIRAPVGQGKYHFSGYTFSDLSERFRGVSAHWVVTN
jgi:hypothetical protein